MTRVLKGGLATLPLALLCDLSGTTAENVVRSIEERITGESERENQRKLWTSTYLMAGLRYRSEIVGKLLEKAVAQMKESSTYQQILADGRADGERVVFLKFARLRFGEPDEKTMAVIQSASSQTIELWSDELNKVESWAELVKV